MVLSYVYGGNFVYVQVVAAAARSLKTAEDFCEKFGISKPVEGYDELAEIPDVDVVYVGVIHPYHYQVRQLFETA